MHKAGWYPALPPDTMNLTNTDRKGRGTPRHIYTFTTRQSSQPQTTLSTHAITLHTTRSSQSASDQTPQRGRHTATSTSSHEDSMHMHADDKQPHMYSSSPKMAHPAVFDGSTSDLPAGACTTRPGRKPMQNCVCEVDVGVGSKTLSPRV